MERALEFHQQAEEKKMNWQRIKWGKSGGSERSFWQKRDGNKMIDST